MSVLRRWAGVVMLLAATSWGQTDNLEPSSPRAAETRPRVSELQARAGLANTAAGLRDQKELRVAYIGGGMVSETPSWRASATAWLKAQFPQCRISETVAGVPGTGSVLGAFRLRQDILAENPQVIFIEFANNDLYTPDREIHRAMEGMVRQIWSANAHTDIVFVYTLHESMLKDLEQGQLGRPVEAMERIADYYGVPSIHLGVEVARKIREGRVVLQVKTAEEKAALGDKIVFSKNGVNPTDAGQKLYGAALERSFTTLLADAPTAAVAHPLPDPLVASNYEKSRLVSPQDLGIAANLEKVGNDDLTRQSLDNALKTAPKPELFVLKRPETELQFKFRGTLVGVYDVLGPESGQILYTIDGGEAITKPRFDPHCTFPRLGYWILAKDLPDAEHTVTIKLHSDPPDKGGILNKLGHKLADGKGYEHNWWYVSQIMLLGEVVR